MHSNGLSHFRKGHYLENNIEACLRMVKNEHYSEIQCEDEDAADYLYTDAWCFLHGSCNLFALVLHEKFGYDVYEIRDDKDRMVHMFCQGTYKGQDVYIDVRGVTTDCVECFSEFRAFLQGGYKISSCDIDEDMRLEDEGDKTGYSFAKALVEKFPRYYDVSM